MKVRLLTSVKLGATRHSEGDEVEVTDAEGKRLVDAGLASKPAAAKKATSKE